MKVDDPEFELCGPLSVSLSLNEKAFPYLSYDENSFRLDLDPKKTTGPESFDKAILLFKRGDFVLETPVTADIVPCEVQ